MEPSPAPRPPFKWKAAPTATDPDAIRILGDWALLNITSFACDQTEKWCRRRIITLNHEVQADFLALWKAWEDQELLQPFVDDMPSYSRFITFNGGWVARYKRGLTLAQHDQQIRHLSNHASGHAFDVMAARYPRGRVVDGADPIHALAQAAEATGRWKWGGSFPTTDPMHFQHVKSLFP